MLCPTSIYSMSKVGGDMGLRRISGETWMGFIIILAPHVYERNVRSDVAMLVKHVQYGNPLPLLCKKPMFYDPH